MQMNLKTRIRSTGMRYFSSERFQQRMQIQAQKKRAKTGEPPVVHYFHQVDDPYSHLAVQKLDQLSTTYDVRFQPHLAGKPGAEYQGSAAHFDQWARQDCVSVARDYNTEFVPEIDIPNAELVTLANGVLATHLDHDDFASTAMQIGTSLWSDQRIEASHDTRAGEQAIREGNALRQALGHYQGAMFYFEGEWYWGIDRIRLLEERLVKEGYGNRKSDLCVPEPTPKDTRDANASDVLLEYFPSLRSPYTAIGHRRVLDLIARSGVSVEVRPLMPMLMRSVPAPRAKQRYIITDAGREARAHGVPFGRIVDPFGEPVKKAFSLFPGAKALGKDMDFVTAYLAAAWYEGVDITTEKGLRLVASNAGIEWDALQNAARNTEWETILTENLNEMFKQNLWGVPSFRVSGGKPSAGGNAPAYACWGQDRIWRVENEIAART